MILKVTINEGMGSIRCPFPPFSLDEETRKSVFVFERTEQLKQLEDEGIVNVEMITEAAYNEVRKIVSRRLTMKAIAKKRGQLNRLIKTGGKDKVMTGSGLTMTIDPGDATPEEIAAEATQELKDLDSLVGKEGKEEPPKLLSAPVVPQTPDPPPPPDDELPPEVPKVLAPEGPPDDIANFLQSEGVEA